MKGEWCYFKSYFSPEYCDKLISQAKKLKFQDAFLGVYGESEVPNYRRSNIAWMYPNEFPDFYTNLWKMADQANKEWFGFDIDGLEHVQFAEYNLENRGEYKKHHDVFWINNGPKHRKLTAVIQLTDNEYYDGCDLKLYECNSHPNREEIRQQGTVIFFPSWLYHSVEPIISGTRYSAVAWFEGPKWK